MTCFPSTGDKRDVLGGCFRTRLSFLSPSLSTSVLKRLQQPRSRATHRDMWRGQEATLVARRWGCSSVHHDAGPPSLPRPESRQSCPWGSSEENTKIACTALQNTFSRSDLLSSALAIFTPQLFFMIFHQLSKKVPTPPEPDEQAGEGEAWVGSCDASSTARSAR